MTSVRGLRGATTVASNSKEAIISATKELLAKLQAENQFLVEAVASIIFSATEGLNAEFPAVAARELGWNETPLLCVREIAVPGSLPNCIRVLLHINTDQPQKSLHHVYLGGAVNLRR